ncbi:hypothetical protein, partial [Klebsiella pneumoniae]|uniref:hypothetical protein n=1 Tax=Klebsiella pneumoniae TaxID=573 RepID=UPI003F518080
ALSLFTVAFQQSIQGTSASRLTCGLIPGIAATSAGKRVLMVGGLLKSQGFHYQHMLQIILAARFLGKNP